MINPDPIYRSQYKFELRECIGKTEDVHESLCMHSSIVAREMAAKGVIVCRVCNKPLPEGVVRCNDHKILQHPECIQPICGDCAKDKPDKFHLAFKHGVEVMHFGGKEFPPLYLEVSRIIYANEQSIQDEKDKWYSK